jgi:hypothetical protein
MSEEIWKPISGFSNYEISSLGRVKNIKFNNILKTDSLRKEYRYVSLYISNCPTKFSIHQLVAREFIPNPENKPEIDHINRNKLDNTISNLRWVTHSEQMRNRVMPLPKSGHKYIAISDSNHYRVHIHSQDITYTNRTFKTLEEAITFRDETLRTVPHPGCS